MTSTRALISELCETRGELGRAARRRKVELLAALRERPVKSPRLLRRLHDAACFLRAFADGPEVFDAARRCLESIVQQVAALPAPVRKRLDDSGIEGTAIHEAFSLEIANWLVAEKRADVEIDWRAIEAPDALDELLSKLLTPSEEAFWESGEVTTREWVSLAKGPKETSDLRWLIRQCPRETDRRKCWSKRYEVAGVTLRWRLKGANLSRTFNEISWLTRFGVRKKWRKPARNPRNQIARPIPGIRRLSPKKARDVIDASRAALASRRREVYAVNHANCDEVYLASVGEGVHIAVMGVLPQYRLNLEANYGYVILSHGRPIGYGGVSPLFKQGNTGVNVFDEYRRGESRFLFVQVLRVFHSLFGTTHFIANPYQFGAENSEAMASGAFWAYYKIGFRPNDPKLKQKAKVIAESRSFRRGIAPARSKVKELVRGDLVLSLSGTKSGDLFEERYLATLGKLITETIADAGHFPRNAAIDRLLGNVRNQLRPVQLGRLNAAAQVGFSHLGPILALLTDLPSWPASDKRSLAALIRSKGLRQEREYARRLLAHRRLRTALQRICREAP